MAIADAVARPSCLPLIVDDEDAGGGTEHKDEASVSESGDSEALATTAAWLSCRLQLATTSRASVDLPLAGMPARPTSRRCDSSVLFHSLCQHVVNMSIRHKSDSLFQPLDEVL